MCPDNTHTDHHDITRKDLTSSTLADRFLSSQKQELQSMILSPRLVLAKHPVKTELRQNCWSDLSGQRASPGREYSYIVRSQVSMFGVGRLEH